MPCSCRCARHLPPSLTVPSQAPGVFTPFFWYGFPGRVSRLPLAEIVAGFPFFFLTALSLFLRQFMSEVSFKVIDGCCCVVFSCLLSLAAPDFLARILIFFLRGTVSAVRFFHLLPKSMLASLPLIVQNNPSFGFSGSPSVPLLFSFHVSMFAFWSSRSFKTFPTHSHKMLSPPFPVLGVPFPNSKA